MFIDHLVQVSLVLLRDTRRRSRSWLIFSATHDFNWTRRLIWFLLILRLICVKLCVRGCLLFENSSICNVLLSLGPLIRFNKIHSFSILGNRIAYWLLVQLRLVLQLVYKLRLFCLLNNKHLIWFLFLYNWWSFILWLLLRIFSLLTFSVIDSSDVLLTAESLAPWISLRCSSFDISFEILRFNYRFLFWKVANQVLPFRLLSMWLSPIAHLWSWCLLDLS